LLVLRKNDLVKMHGIKCQNNRKQFEKNKDKKERVIQISGVESSIKTLIGRTGITFLQRNQIS